MLRSGSRVEENAMPTKGAQLTDDEMRAIIGEVVEQKLLELFDDPEAGLVITTTLRNRLLCQKKATAKGDYGRWVNERSHRVNARSGVSGG